MPDAPFPLPRRHPIGWISAPRPRARANARRAGGVRRVWLIAAACLAAASARPGRAQHDAGSVAAVEESADFVATAPAPVEDAVARPRIVHADVVALDQMLVYNRFGSFNPYGMIFALRRDVVALGAPSSKPGADACSDRVGTSPGAGGLELGAVRLRDCKRPRPLVLRANAGDVLELAVTNLLRPSAPDISQTWCDRQPDAGTPPTRADERRAFAGQCKEQASPGPRPGDDAPTDWPATRGLSLVIPGLEPLPTRHADGTEGVERACLGLDAVPPGGRFTCRWRLEREGTHLFSSLAAPAGGEGDGGSLMHGLFGAVLVEPKGSVALRGQVTRAAFDRVWAPRAPVSADPAGVPRSTDARSTDARSTDGAAPGSVRHARADAVRYDAAVIYRLPRSPDPAGGAFACATGPTPAHDTVPILRMTRGCAGEETIAGTPYRKAEIVHGDLNAIIVPPPRVAPPEPAPGGAGGVPRTGEDARMQAFLARDAAEPFREFTVIFHDELKTFYADAFRDLDRFGQLSGVRDGFAINYGTSGFGPILVANRTGIGPAAACPECQYEEFYLESWANGDPALLEAHPDDPSNVHHSYLNDKVVFRNLHAGKETHVFHLHTHQWFAGNDQNRGSYLDSQTIGPQQGFTYRIYHGGLDRHAPDAAIPGAARGWWETAQASGNRNRTPGDAIFHCHLYPHLAQGMWALWRVHDALEDGTRVLPDGQDVPGLSVERNPRPEARRLGSVDPVTGAWRGTGEREGTPVPGLIPIPGGAAPPLPTYTAPPPANEAPEQAAGRADGMPGYPFYVAGRPGHRAPQPPLDMAFDADAGGLLDGGLPRHVVTGGRSVPAVLTPAERQAAAGAPAPDGLVARMLALGDATTEYETLALQVLPHEGTRLERNAMAFHHDGRRRDGAAPSDAAPVDVRDAAGRPVAQEAGSYAAPVLPRDTSAPGGLVPGAGWFSVNGAPSAPGAPFANPCGTANGLDGTPYRRFQAVAAQGGPPGGFATRVFAASDDPLTHGDPALSPLGPMVPDPGLTGFRRFDVSAVQIDMVVNRAGWHDPQARVAVLTADAPGLKRAEGGVTKTARAEPFFFRAFSGECVEMRHTNELPKDLELDDFQLRVPTDTVGQHIHLVKFDVTSSDGSGNGFNYEDGTFAADEILARICAATGGRPGDARPPVPGETENRRVAAREGECEAVRAARAAFERAVAGGDRDAIARARRGLREVELWRRPREGDARRYFQTTVQRWFADPILSNTGDGLAADRTLRTVFSHDHFSPSNIQQHGYYTALTIEPQGSSFCVNGPPEDAATASRCAPGKAATATVAQPAPWDGAGAPPFARGDELHVGTRATVFGPEGDVLHPDTREFALAIADFALLYDGAGQDRRAFDADTRPPPGDGPNGAGASDGEEHKGLARLVGEAECRSAGDAGRDPDIEAGEAIPAQVAPLCAPARPPGRPDAADGAGRPVPAHRGQVAALREHAESWRAAHGRPVAPPPRPEAISQKHHDPYLVNYRNEPVPLRLASDGRDGAPPAFARNPCVVPDEANRPNRINHRDLRRQHAGEAGDPANAFRTAWGERWEAGHGDPCTPVMDAVQGDRVQFRLIQGAHEVQHMFTVEGRPFRRNLDQTFPAAVAGPAATPGPDLRGRCLAAAQALAWRPREYDRFLRGESGLGGDWPNIAQALARCDNVEGYTGSREVGISEHIEFASVFRRDTTFLRRLALGPDAPPGAQPGAPRGPDEGTTPTPRGPELRALRGMPTDQRERLFRPDPQGQMVLPPGFNDAAPLPPADPRAGELPLADYLVHLGSLDAMWNGAWGLLRVHAPGEGGTDVTECLAGRRSASGERTPPEECRKRLGDGALPELSRRLPEIEPLDTAGAADTPAVCPASAGPPVRAVLLARRVGELFYDPARRLADPDALAFVALQARDLPPGVLDRLFPARGDPEAASALARPAPAGLMPALAGAAARVAADPRPIRVEAGRCLEMAVVNGLPPDMPDHRGDAPMPKIVPLNVDRDRAGPGPDGAPDDASYRVPGASSVGQLRPSSRLAVSLALPGLDRVQAVPLPYGVNATGALRPGETAVLRFYAGRVGIGPLGRSFTPYAFGPAVVRSVSDPFNHVPHGLFATVVVEPQGTTVEAEDPAAGGAGALLSMPGVPGDGPARVRVREHLLVMQDGLNLHAPRPSPPRPGPGPRRPQLVQAGPAEGRGPSGGNGGPPFPLPASPLSRPAPLPNCPVCDDSYDQGEKGVNRRSAPFTLRLAGQPGVPGVLGLYDPSTYPQDAANLNRYRFPPDFFTDAFRPIPTSVLDALRDEQVMIRLVHPGGRARQRAFVPLGAHYDDVFPGFGSGHAGLLGPGKTLTAGLCAPRVAGDYLWRDGPQHIFAGGVWGMLRVQGGRADADASCGRDGAP